MNFTKKIQEQTPKNERITNFTSWVISNRWLVVLLSLALVLSLGSGARLLTFSNDYHIYFGEDNPKVIAFANNIIFEFQIFITTHPKSTFISIVNNIVTNF